MGCWGIRRGRRQQCGPPRCTCVRCWHACMQGGALGRSSALRRPSHPPTPRKVRLGSAAGPLCGCRGGFAEFQSSPEDSVAAAPSGGIASLSRVSGPGLGGAELRGRLRLALGGAVREAQDLRLVSCPRAVFPRRGCRFSCANRRPFPIVLHLLRAMVSTSSACSPASSRHFLSVLPVPLPARLTGLSPLPQPGHLGSL